MEWVLTLVCLLLLADFAWSIIVDRKTMSPTAKPVSQVSQMNAQRHDMN